MSGHVDYYVYLDWMDWVVAV